MFKFKIILITLGMVSLSAQAIDLQSKFRNTDRSLLETVSDYQTIDPGRFYFSNTASLISNPLVDPKTGKILADSLRDMEFSVVGSFYKNWEVGLSVPFLQSTTTPGSNLKGYSGIGDIYLENKFHLWENISLIPVYIVQQNKGLAGTGSNQGGYGLKVVGSFFEKSRLPFYYSLGYYSLPETAYGSIDQSQRVQASIGSLYKLTKEIVAGGEFYIDQAKNRSAKEILAHITAHLDNFSVRAGVGSGFLNEDKLNDLRVFASLLFDLDFRSKNKVNIIKVKKQDSSEKQNKIQATSNLELNSDPLDVVSIPELEKSSEPINTKEQEEKQEVNEKIKEIEALQKKLEKQVLYIDKSSLVLAMNEEIDPHFLVENSLVQNHGTAEDDVSVIPVLTVKDLKQLKKQISEEKKEEVSLEQVLIEKNQRLRSAQSNLSFWISEFENNRLNYEKTKTELIWGLRVVDRRRNTLKDLYSKNADKLDSLPEGKFFLLISPEEKKAQDIVKQKTVVGLLEKNPKIKTDLKQSDVQIIEVSVEKQNKVEPIIDLEPKKAIKEENIVVKTREQRLEESQKKAWEISKKKTLRDFIAEKKKIKLEEQTPVIETPNTKDQLVKESESEVLKTEAETPTTEVKNDKSIVVDPLKTEVVEKKPSNNSSDIPSDINKTIVIGSLPEETKMTLDKIDTKVDQENTKPIEPAIEPASIVVVPQIESLVSDSIDLKISHEGEATKETLEKVNLLLNQKKKEQEEKQKYQELIRYYENELNKIKKKIEDNQIIKPETPLKQIEIEQTNKIETNFKEDGSVEIKQFKLNSIKERFQEEQFKEEPKLENDIEIIRPGNVGGLIEDGELEISNGPIF